MIVNIEEKYQQLTPAQKDIFAGYGLRQVKHFVEINLPAIEAELPADTVVQGINSEGKIQALNTKSGQAYVWISDQQWQERSQADSQIDRKEDFSAVWTIFELKNYPLIELSHVHRDFLAPQADV